MGMVGLILDRKLVKDQSTRITIGGWWVGLSFFERIARSQLVSQSVSQSLEFDRTHRIFYNLTANQTKPNLSSGIIFTGHVWYCHVMAL